jgi:hypothetical protein
MLLLSGQAAELAWHIEEAYSSAVVELAAVRAAGKL